MNRLLSCLLVCVLLVPAAMPAKASDAACPTPLRIGLSDLGFSSYRDNGAYKGTSVAIAEELSRRTGCAIQMVWFPRQRLFAQFGAGQVELVMSSLHSAERDRVGRYIPYSYTQFELLLDKSVPGTFASLADFVEHSTARLNITRGVYYPPEALVQLERLSLLGRLEYVNDYDVVFKKILAGRAEGTFSPAITHLLHVRRYSLTLRMRSLPVTETPHNIIGTYVSRSNVTLAQYQRFVRTLRAMLEDGTIEKIYTRQVGTEFAKRTFAGGNRDILDAIAALPPD